MYACIHVSNHPAAASDLLSLALNFSPTVEQTSPDTVVFSIAALRKLIGSPHQIASEIARLGFERNLTANLAIASNPDAAILLARNFPGVTLVTPGEERLKLAPIPLHGLFLHDTSLDPALLDILHRWGLKTCEDLAALPNPGLAERLGPPGVYLRSLACGSIDRPLRILPPPTNYETRIELEHTLHLLEPLLFLLSRALSELCTRLRSQSRAARSLETHFDLEDHKPYRCELEFPVPLDETQTMLKLLQLHLERHPPEAPILAFTVRVDPALPRRIQGGIFLPPTPPPDKLQVTIARIAAMVGQENVGAPMLIDTHRPDAFQMIALNSDCSGAHNAHRTGCALTISAPSSLPAEAAQASSQTLRLAMRLFRPALHARVRLIEAAPKHVAAAGVKGNVVRHAGPWKTSGEWWTSTAWTREEWDVALDDGALYRICCEIPAREWYVHAVYD